MTWFVCFVDDGSFVGRGKGVSVYTVVGGVELAFGEPGDVALGEGTRANGLEGAVPGNGFVCFLRCKDC